MGDAVALQGLDWGEDMVGVCRGLLWRGPGWKGLRGDLSHWAKGEGQAFKNIKQIIFSLTGQKCPTVCVKMLACIGLVWLNWDCTYPAYHNRKSVLICQKLSEYRVHGLWASSYLCTAVSLSISIFTRTGEILHQNSREDADNTVKLSLPETVILMCLSAEDADDGAFWKRQLIIRLSRIVVQGLRKWHCNREGQVKKQ